MSLPSSERSEPLPNDINELPPARQRHIRRQPRSASLAERQILLDSLLQLTAPKLNFFVFALLGAFSIAGAFYFDEPVMMILAVVLFPFLTPLFALSLLPTAQKYQHTLKSMVSLLIPFLLTITVGVLVGWLQKSTHFSRLDIYHFSAPYWLDMTLVGVSVFFGALVLIRQGRLPRLIGVLLAYEILVPLALAGFGFVIGDTRFWPNALLISLLHFGIGVVLAIFSFLILGFAPKRARGWLMVLIALALTLTLLAAVMHFPTLRNPLALSNPPTSTSTSMPSQTPSPEPNPSATPVQPSATETSVVTHTPSQTATITPTSTLTGTPQPTTYPAVIDTITGAVLREIPDFEAPVVGYANDGESVEILEERSIDGGSRWFHVRTSRGEMGWVLGSLVITQTPTPSPTVE